MRYLTIFFVFFCCLFHLNSVAQVIKLDRNFKYRNLGKQVLFLEDKTDKLSLEEVRSLDSTGRFKQGKEEILNLGNTKSAFWIKINYISASTALDYLILDVPNIENIDCYTLLDGRKTIHQVAGAIIPSPHDVDVTNNFIFTLPHQGFNTKTTTVFLRLRTNNILMVPIKMATSETYVPGSTKKDTLEILYIGVLITLFLFNIFLYFSIRDSLYLYYGLYVVSLGLYVVLYLRGYGYMLGDNLRIQLNYYPHIFLSISVAASVLFSRRFLNLDKLFPKMTKVCDFLVGCCILMFLTSILGFKSLSASLAQYITMLASVVLWVSGIMAYRKGHQPAKYYILAWTFITFTVLAVALSLQGILNYYDYTFEFVPVGSTIELLLLSFALGDRYTTLIVNEQKARDENLLLVQNQNQRLEKQVKDRTLKLSETIAQLEASNAVKNKLFSIIAHDLRSPFNSLISIFSLKDMDMLSLDDLKMLLNENRKNIETIHNTLNNLLYWAKSQMEEVKTQRICFDLKAMTEDLILVYQPLIDKKEILTNLNLQGEFKVYADENQIQLVLRNLIDNAIKFTPKGQRIEVSLIHVEMQVEICVSNTIQNPSMLDIDLMNSSTFEATYGTAGEKGVGLGLHLCREYVQNNGGVLEARVNGTEISFCFKLPDCPD